MLYTDKLYDRAFELKNAKKWRSLGQNFMIAIDTWQQGCWYAIPVTKGHNHKAAGFVLEGGQAGLKWAMDLVNLELQKSLDDYERMVQDRYHEEYLLTYADQRQMAGWQDLDAVKDYCKRKGLVARGSNFYPTFRYMAPMEMSWILKDERQVKLCETVLGALLALEQHLGNDLKPQDGMWQYMGKLGDYRGIIPALVEQEDGEWIFSAKLVEGYYEHQWPTAVLSEFEIAKLKRVKKNADVWMVDKFLYGEPVFWDDFFVKHYYRDKAPEKPGYYPNGAVMLNDASGDVLVLNQSCFRLDGYRAIADMLRDGFKRCGRPRRFVVCRKESYEFFKDICQKLDIELEMVDDLPELMSIRQDCIDRTNRGENLEDIGDEDEYELDELTKESGHCLDGRGKRTGFVQKKFPENGEFTKEMFMSFMEAFWRKRKISKLTMEELEDMLNNCIMMPCNKEAVDFVFDEVRKRCNAGEIIGVEMIPGENAPRKKKK